jgi:hypothetical protein
MYTYFIYKRQSDHNIVECANILRDSLGMKQNKLECSAADVPEELGDIAIVKDGFSWYAFLFGVFWLIYHKLWKILLLTVIAVNALQYFGVHHYGLDVLVMSIMLGVYGNSLLSYQLCSEGFVVTDMVRAASKNEALIRAGLY